MGEMEDWVARKDRGIGWVEETLLGREEERPRCIDLGGEL